jgi:hypothetical protein
MIITGKITSKPAWGSDTSLNIECVWKADQSEVTNKALLNC